MRGKVDLLEGWLSTFKETCYTEDCKKKITMETIKSFTDLSQSKALAKILPLESADMHYSKDFDGRWFVDLAQYSSVKVPKYVVNVEEHLLPCWSLAMLLDVLKDNITIEKTLFDQSDFFTYSISGDAYEYKTHEHDNLIDACYELILKLHELKML